MTGITRRQFLQGVSTIGLGALLGGCAPAAPTAAPATSAPATAAAAEVPTAAPAPAKAIELEVWTGWTEDAATQIEKILAGYNSSQSGVVAKHVVVPEDMTQKLLAAISAGSPPGTAVLFGAGTAYQLAAQKALLALDEVGQPSQVAALKQWMLPALWDLGTYQGKLVFASMWNQCWGLFVNTKMCRDKGIDPAKPPKTLQELDAVYDQLTTYDDKGNIDILGGDNTWVGTIIGRFLGQYVSEDGRTIVANSENNLKALEWITGRWNKMGPQKLQDFYASLQGRGERSAGNDPFLSGLRATYMTGPWQFNTIKLYKPEGFEFTVWPWPGPEGVAKKGMYTYGDGWIIPKGSKDPAAAWDVIGTMTGATGDKDVYTSLFVTWQCVNGPVSSQILDWPRFKNEVIGACPGYQEVFLDDLLHSEQYLYPPKVPTSASYESLMDSHWEKARLGQMTPKEALDAVTQQAQKELDDWYTNNPD